MTALAGETWTLSFAPGVPLSGDDDPAVLAEAVAVAEAADVAVVFLGLPEGEESEGHDREHLDLPDVQLQLLAAVAEVNRDVVVVLANGGVVEVASWQHHAKAVLEGWLSGQAGGGAIADFLFGRANPSGRLAETDPATAAGHPLLPELPRRGRRRHLR